MPTNPPEKSLMADHERLCRETQELLKQPASDGRAAQMIEISTELRRLSQAIRGESRKAREVARLCSERNHLLVRSVSAKRMY